MTINLSQELVDTIVAEIEKARRTGYRAGVEAGKAEREKVIEALEKQTNFVIAWIDAAYVARQQIFGPNDKVDYAVAKAEARAVLEEVKG